MRLIGYVIVFSMAFIAVGVFYYALVTKWPLPKDSKKSKS